MSSEVAIRIENLGKRFDFFHHPAGLLLKQFVPLEAKTRSWALRNVSFEVHPGQCLGIVGRNGSGKSTLLSLLAGTQTASEGRAEVIGRVVALLELGAGFHHDFTGRENVYLSASLYGLSGKQVSQRIGEIERLAGIGGFIDRPVREYSSGMFARLAFAVAAHVDADILIVDEILGVGDLMFQQRCAEFIRGFRQRGIVLLVSHSEHTVLSLCTHALWLDAGRVVLQGSPRAVTHAYHADTARLAAATAGGFSAGGQLLDLGSSEARKSAALAGQGVDFDQLPVASAGGVITACSLSSGGEALVSASGGEEAMLAIRCSLPTPTSVPLIGFAVRNSLGEAVLAAESHELGLSIAAGTQDFEACFTFELPYFPSGTYTIDVVLFDIAGSSPTLLARAQAGKAFHVLSQHVSAGMANSAPLTAEFWLDGELVRP